MRRAQAEDSSPSSRSFSVGNVCYTESMQKSRCHWDQWAQILQKMGVKDLVVSVLEGAGSFRYLAAQFVHASTPFFAHPAASDQWQALADMLEDRETALQFISFLKGEDKP